ncbi:autotransporter domain-containing protein [Candidatus Pelagibacter sp.]|uniref:autotransporter domain-containing protein n=1 Tax=Candidatus Pelagibacter sp. TaxID=2024849 RepID=UPI003F864C43
MKFFWFLIFFVYGLNIAQAGIVEPVFVQLKDPNLDGEDDEPSTVSIAITPDGKKMFVMDHLRDGATDGNAIFIYDLATAFDISTMDVTNRTIVNTTGLGDNLGNIDGNKTIKFSNDGKKLFLFNSNGSAQFHNLTSPYDVASISASTLIPDDGLNYKTAYNSSAINDLKGVAFNNDGTKMYLNDGTKGTTDVTQVKLSTPFDPSSGTFEYNLNTTSTVGNGTFTMDLYFDDDGTRLYISQGLENSTGSAAHIFVWKLSTPFELSSATYVDKYQIDGNGNNVSAYGWTFGNNGMKAYIGTEDANDDGDDIIYEYDLTCPYGIVLCENETASAISAQVEIAKNVIYQNSNTIFKRFDWLRRNEEKTNLNSHNIKLNINNPILASLKNKLENSLNSNLTNSLEYTQASLKDKNPLKNMRNWSHWSHGDISFGRVGEKGFIKPKDIRTKGIMIGADKLINNKIFGLAFRYGNDDVKIDTGAGNKLDSQAYTLNLYGSLPLDGKSNLNALIGASFLSIDQLVKGTITGERYGRQIFTSLTYQNENEYTNYDLIPFGKFEIGITQLSEYTDFGTSATNSVDLHDRLTFKTGNISGGLKFDNILYLDQKTLSRNGFVEYIFDLTPDIDHFFTNYHDNKLVRKTIKKHSLHNIKGNIGFEYMNVNGYTFAINYERFQSLSDSAYSDSFLFKLGKKQIQNANLDVIYDPMNNNNTEISYLKNFGNFNLKLNSNYSLFSKIPDYGANLEVSGTF